MVFGTYSNKGKVNICCIDKIGERIFPLDSFLEQFFKEEEKPKTMLEFIKAYKQSWTDEIAIYYGERPEMAISLQEVRLLAPIPNPARNLVCLGKNYKAHAEELKGQIFSD